MVGTLDSSGSSFGLVQTSVVLVLGDVLFNVPLRGSLLELSWGGKEPFTVGGRERTFLEDGDEVTLRYTAPGTGGGRISLGEVTGRILPAR